jgi:hypothetical protein
VNGDRMNIRGFLKRNLWIISISYLIWGIIAAYTTAYFSSSSTFRTPVGDAVCYWIAYMAIVPINAYHCVMLKTSSSSNSSNSPACTVSNEKPVYVSASDGLELTDITIATTVENLPTHA